MKPGENAETHYQRIFVGKNADYYLARWSSLTGEGVGFSWPAFFLGGLWLSYRKMYRNYFILYGVVFGKVAAENLLFRGLLNMPPPPILSWIFLIAMATILGKYGNRWYLMHVQKHIAELRLKGLDEPELVHELAKRGGVSWLAMLGLMLLSFAINITLATLLQGFFLYVEQTPQTGP